MTEPNEPSHYHKYLPYNASIQLQLPDMYSGVISDVPAHLNPLIRGFPCSAQWHTVVL